MGKKINSVALEATFFDCISDCVSTAVVLASVVLSAVIKDVPIDGYAGVIVSLFIAYTGIRSLKDIADVLLGKAPDRE